MVYDARTADKEREEGLVVVPVPSSKSGSGLGQCVLTYMASDIGSLDEFVRRLEEEHAGVKYNVCALTGQAPAAQRPPRH